MTIDVNPASREEIVALWEESPHSSVFTHPDVLSRLSQGVDWWIAWKGQEPQCFWPVCTPVGTEVGLPDLTYYVGPMWTSVAFPIAPHRWLTRTKRVYEAFIQRFLSEYGCIHACLPKGLLDVRAFDWWNYHQDDKPRFLLKPRYTACIHELDQKDEKSITGEFRQLRRRELRSLKKGGPPPRTDQWSVDDLLRLYSDVMGCQDVGLESENRSKIQALADLVRNGIGDVVAFMDPANEETIAACLILFGKGEANMVLNLVDSHWRESGLPAWMVTETIKAAQEKGMRTFDFNGANSPNRGDDKHSYGAEPVLFFEVHYSE